MSGRHRGEGRSADDAAILADVDRALAVAGVRALVLFARDALPFVDLLVRRRQAQAAHRALDGLGWRWRAGGDGTWRFTARRDYRFDGGFTVVVHRGLPAAPLPGVSFLTLERRLWRTAGETRPGLCSLERAPALVYATLQAARRRMRSRAELDEIAEMARGSDLAQVLRIARVGRVATPVGRALVAAGVVAGSEGTSGPDGGALLDGRAGAWVSRNAYALARHARPRRLRELAAGGPWGHAVVRCRFAGLELLAGPETFLPRGVSERLVQATVARIGADRKPCVVEVGTGCGAVALALAHRFAAARVWGIELEDEPLRWARRNAERLRPIEVTFLRGSLLDPLPPKARGMVDVVVGNVPCVPESSFEAAADAPAVAYVGSGADGLGLQRRLASQALEVLRPGGHLLLQLAPDQWTVLATDLARMGYAIEDAQGDEVAVVGAARSPSR